MWNHKRITSYSDIHNKQASSLTQLINNIITKGQYLPEKEIMLLEKGVIYDGKVH